MPLIKSISGIRGTIGGQVGEGLTPIDIYRYTISYSKLIKEKKDKPIIVIGRDARISGEMVKQLVINTLISVGVNVIDIDLAPTPTVEIAVKHLKADGGIIITASHNPIEWNALKLLNQEGEFLSPSEAKYIIEQYKQAENATFSKVFNLGKIERNKNMIREHIEQIRHLEYVKHMQISKARYTVAVDCINSVGALSVPILLKELGVRNIYTINCVPNGIFAHNPEPLPEHLRQLSDLVKSKKADVGFAVDPDVDRLAIVSEDGSFFGEEYTLVAIADYVLSQKTGNTVSNLSSSMALKEITELHGGNYYASAVGEINVVQKMKEVNAIIGGEGNGGVIYPKLHYGRDALVGIALFLSFMAKTGLKVSEIRKKYPNYVIIKDKQEITNLNFEEVFKKIKLQYSSEKIDTQDGLKIYFEKSWVHIRKSNTEPIIRIYAEAETRSKAEALISQIKKTVQK